MNKEYCMAEANTVPDRRGDDPKLTEITRRIDGLVTQHGDLAARQNAIIAEVRDNTEITKRIEESTSGLVSAWDALSGGLKVLNMLGKVAKWVTIVAATFTAVMSAVYVATHGGTPPPTP